MGSLEKLVESSFNDMKSVGKKKNVVTGGNGILQRLGIDDVDQSASFHSFVSMPMSRAEVKRPASNVFDIFRASNFTNLKRSSSNVDNDVVSGKGDDDVESEMSDVDRTTPNNVSGNPNPLYALKELCNNTCTTASASTVTQKRRKMTLLKSDESNGRSSSPSPSSTSSTPATPKMLIECRQKDIENNVALKRPIDSECATTDDDENDVDEKSTNDAKKTSASTKIRVKSDSELMRSATSRSRRSRRDAASHEEKRATSAESVTLTSQASQSAAEAKFFRYSELAKVLSAGN